MKKLLLISIAVLFLAGCAGKNTARIETIENKNDTASNSTGDKEQSPADTVPQPSPEEPGKTQDNAGKIPVLMYHYIRTVDKDKDLLGYNLSTDPQIFKQEMDWLKRNGYDAITPSQALSGEMPSNPIILTFDDGYSDFYETAFPILKDEGFKAASAIIVNRIDKSGFMTGEQIKEISDYGIELMSHSMTHPDLGNLSDDNAKTEIVDSKNFLEQHYDKEVSFFVYPSGEYNKKTEDILKNAGYLGAFTTDAGISDFKGNIFELKRIRIDNRDGFDGFKEKILSANK